jgi:hypothetical protein
MVEGIEFAGPVKLDMKLIHGIERNGPRQSIVRAK